VEIHDTDPTTDSPADPWDEVTDRFGELGDRLKSTYRKVADEHGPTEAEIRGAFTTLAGAWGQVADSVTDILRDPGTREGLKRAASSLTNALGSTFTQLSLEFSPGRSQQQSSEEE
jgi:hypothetical protein